MILLIDNYDSFSYNLFQQAAAIEPDMRVVRNDALTVSEIEGLNPCLLYTSSSCTRRRSRRKPTRTAPPVSAIVQWVRPRQRSSSAA